ncbi:hypothetical protein A6B35_30050 (plasmid) [Mesorhizobium amorphae CCNWGS0123]|nr:TraM recognition domain-containing protein [Mesorhizobium amorphae]ANT54302.1 hypothetical protein A6B35_30050 [Mesorhizobium amorphae CCNWGS0123]
MVLILQDLAQLDEVYGKATRQTTVTACQVKLFIRMNDVETSEHVSEMLGPTTIEVPTPIIRAGQGIFGGRDKSLSYQERPFRTAAELRQMPGEPGRGSGLEPPGFMVRKVTYYKDAPYKATYQQFRHRRLKVPPLSRWQDLPLRSMAEVEAAANNAPAAPFELGEPDTVEAPVSSDAAYADAAPPATGAAAGRAGPVGLPKVKSDSADAPQALPSSGLPTGGEAKAKSEVAAEVPQLKPKRPIRRPMMRRGRFPPLAGDRRQQHQRRPTRVRLKARRVSCNSKSGRETSPRRSRRAARIARSGSGGRRSFAVTVSG